MTPEMEDKETTSVKHVNWDMASAISPPINRPPLSKTRTRKLVNIEKDNALSTATDNALPTATNNALPTATDNDNKANAKNSSLKLKNDLWMCDAAEIGDKELVDGCVKEGANNWNKGMCGAAQGGHKELVEFFIKKGANDWNNGMCGAAKNGRRELVEFFIRHGANDWNNGIIGAAQGGYKELVQFFVKKMTPV